MNDNNDKWLDEIISKTINIKKPQFDAEKFKQKFPDEFKTLQLQSNKATKHSVRRISLLRSLFIKISAASAVIIVIISLFPGRDKRLSEIPKLGIRVPSQSETRLISMMSLRLSYQQGGLEALDQQFRETLDVLGPLSLDISMKELLEEKNGS
jgi:hypothetical protein